MANISVNDSDEYSDSMESMLSKRDALPNLASSKAHQPYSAEEASDSTRHEGLLSRKNNKLRSRKPIRENSSEVMIDLRKCLGHSPVVEVENMMRHFFYRQEINLQAYRGLRDSQRALVDRLLPKLLSTRGMEKFLTTRGSSSQCSLSLSLEDLGQRPGGSKSSKRENLIKVALSLGMKCLKKEYRTIHKVSKTHRTGYYVPKATVLTKFFEEYFGPREQLSNTSDMKSAPLDLHRAVGGLTKAFFIRLIGGDESNPKLGLAGKLYNLFASQSGRDILLQSYKESIKSKLATLFAPTGDDEDLDLLCEEIGQRVCSRGLKLPKTLQQLEICLDCAKNKILNLGAECGITREMLEKAANIESPSQEEEVSRRLSSAPQQFIPVEDPLKFLEEPSCSPRVDGVCRYFSRGSLGYFSSRQNSKDLQLH